MQFAAAISRREKTEEAAQQLIASIQFQMPGEIDLLMVFLTGEHRNTAAFLAARLRQELSPRVLLGCTCEGVVGGDKEVEREPGVSVLAGRLPGVSLTPFHIGFDEWEALLDTDNTSSLQRRLGLHRKDGMSRACLVMGDPFTTPVVDMLEAFESVLPGMPVIGGMASSAYHPGENVLLLNDAFWEEGLIGVRIAGPVRIDTVVSQGCRPIGETMLVTRAEGNIISTLGGKSALAVARKTLGSLSRAEQELVENGVFLGIVINEYQDSFDRGDFLVRSVLGGDENSGAIAVGDTVRAGQTVQFHLRDAQTADEDLRMLMARIAQDETAPTGGLVFTCNGRGVRMFELPNHDVRAVLDSVPETPLAGFFAQGEIGPIGGKSFIHGHTASIVLFRQESRES